MKSFLETGGILTKAEAGALARVMSWIWRPCPFCDGEAGLKFERALAISSPWPWHMECSICHATGPWAMDPESAIEAWNGTPRVNKIRYSQHHMDCTLPEKPDGKDKVKK